MGAEGERQGDVRLYKDPNLSEQTACSCELSPPASPTFLSGMEGPTELPLKLKDSRHGPSSRRWASDSELHLLKSSAGCGTVAVLT
jgi:hypothetical protein